MTRDQAKTHHTDRRRDAPRIYCRVRKSADGRYVIHTTEITDVKRAGYYEAVLNGKCSNVEVVEVVV